MTKTPENLVQVECKQILEELKTLKDRGRLVSELFLALPSKVVYPEYYEIIKSPISLEEIEKSLDRYSSPQDFKKDIELMVDNARTFNDPKSQVYQDALLILKKTNSLIKPQETKRKKRESLKATIDPIDELLAAIPADDMETAERIIAAQDFNPNVLGATRELDEEFDWSALHCACFFGKRKIVELLMEKGANVELADTLFQGRALAWAAYAGHVNVCKLLINKYNADQFAKNIHGQTAYDLAPEKSEKFKFLIEKEQPKPIRIKLVSNPSESEVNEEVLRKRRGRPRKSDAIQDELIDIEEPVAEPQVPLPSFAKGNIVTSVGLVSNANLLRVILSTDIYGHSINVDSSVRTLNLRVLVNPKAPNSSQIVVSHNSVALKQLRTEEKLSNTYDYTAVLLPGLNSFDVVASGGSESGYQSWAVFINKTD